MPYQPLIYPLESIPTFSRVLRFLQIEFTHEQLGQISQQIGHEYKRLHPEAPPVYVMAKRLSGKKPKKKTALYPVEFIPTMIQMVQDYKKQLDQPLKQKRSRIRTKISPTKVFSTGSEKSTNLFKSEFEKQNKQI